jgi:hypothetical protein
MNVLWMGWNADKALGMNDASEDEYEYEDEWDYISGCGLTTTTSTKNVGIHHSSEQKH